MSYVHLPASDDLFDARNASPIERNQAIWVLAVALAKDLRSEMPHGCTIAQVLRVQCGAAAYDGGYASQRTDCARLRRWVGQQCQLGPVSRDGLMIVLRSAIFAVYDRPGISGASYLTGMYPSGLEVDYEALECAPPTLCDLHNKHGWNAGRE